MERYSPWMQSPPPASAAKNFGLPLFRVIVGFCGKPWRDVHGHGETSATAGCLSATAVVGSVRLHPLAPFLALTESFPPGSDSTAATWGSTWLPREMVFLICVAGLQQAWHRGNIYISFCNVVAAAAILGTEALAGSGEREAQSTPCHVEIRVEGEGKKRKKERKSATGLLPWKARCVPGCQGCRLPSRWLSQGPSVWKWVNGNCSSGYQWWDQICPRRVLVLLGDQGRGRGVPWLGSFLCYMPNSLLREAGESSSPLAMRQHSAKLGCG